MSDVIAAAAIAGGVGLAGTVATLVSAQLTAAQQRRLRAIDREHTDRATRNEKYSEVAWCVQRFHKYGTIGAPPNRSDWTDWLDSWAYWSGVMAIVGEPAAVDATNTFTRALEHYGPALLAAADEPDRWRHVYEQHSETFDEARLRLLAEMRR
jgi:hypothetical protein